jgi:hypothetical protein
MTRGRCDVWTAQLMRIRAEGGNALDAALQDATPNERLKVQEILLGATPEQRLGLDGGSRAAEVLRKVRSDAYLEEQ